MAFQKYELIITKIHVTHPAAASMRARLRVAVTTEGGGAMAPILTRRTNVFDFF